MCVRRHKIPMCAIKIIKTNRNPTQTGMIMKNIIIYLIIQVNKRVDLLWSPYAYDFLFVSEYSCNWVKLLKISIFPLCDVAKKFQCTVIIFFVICSFKMGWYKNPCIHTQDWGWILWNRYLRAGGMMLWAKLHWFFAFVRLRSEWFDVRSCSFIPWYAIGLAFVTSGATTACQYEYHMNSK